MADIGKTIGDCYQVVSGDRMYTAPKAIVVWWIPSKMRSGEQKYLEVYFWLPLFCVKMRFMRDGGILIDLSNLDIHFSSYMVSILESKNICKVIDEISEKVGNEDERGIKRLFCFTGYIGKDGLNDLETLFEKYPKSVLVCGQYCGWFFGKNYNSCNDLLPFSKHENWLKKYRSLNNDEHWGKLDETYSIVESFHEKYDIYLPLYFSEFFHGKFYYIESSSMYCWDYVIVGSSNISGAAFSLANYRNIEFNLLIQVPKINRIKLWMYEFLGKCFVTKHKNRGGFTTQLSNLDMSEFETDFHTDMVCMDDAGYDLEYEFALICGLDDIFNLYDDLLPFDKFTCEAEELFAYGYDVYDYERYLLAQCPDLSTVEINNKDVRSVEDELHVFLNDKRVQVIEEYMNKLQGRLNHIEDFAKNFVSSVRYDENGNTVYVLLDISDYKLSNNKVVNGFEYSIHGKKRYHDWWNFVKRWSSLYEEKTSYLREYTFRKMNRKDRPNECVMFVDSSIKFTDRSEGTRVYVCYWNRYMVYEYYFRGDDYKVCKFKRCRDIKLDSMVIVQFTGRLCTVIDIRDEGKYFLDDGNEYAVSELVRV